MKAWLLLTLLTAGADEPTRLDSNLPFRTETANRQLPWYKLQAGQFPPHHSEHRFQGELLEADFVRRRGQFRNSESGELVNFTLLPYASVRYLNADADLRDVPLGTQLACSLYQDAQGAFTQAASMQDDFTLLAGQGHSYRLDTAQLDDGKLLVTRQNLSAGQADLGRAELLVNDQTRVWKGDKEVKLGDLTIGDELLVNLSGARSARPACCTAIWSGAQTHKLATEKQRQQHTAFLKQRGLPAWIDRVEGKQVTVTLFGTPADLEALCKAEGIVPAQWAAEHRFIDAVVATDELRTYNPPVDRQRSKVLEFHAAATDRHGSSGVCWVIEPELLLEGFRKGRIVRLFAHPSWPVNDMPYGENVYNETPGGRTETEEPFHYPYRTDFANEHLPWYRLKAGEFPPWQSHHLVGGELVKVDAVHRSGQFRADATGELVNFSMPPFGSVVYLDTDADLADLPLGTRYHYFLHPDDRGAFSKATVIQDEFSRLAGEKLTWRLDAASLVQGKLAQGKLHLARQLAPVKNEKDALVRPPDLGRAEFAVSDATRVWKGGKQVQPADLAPGDELLFNLTGQSASSRGRCTEIWCGTETHKLASEQQRAKHKALLRQRGAPGWIDSVQDKTLTITFFCGQRRDFGAILDGDPWGNKVFVTLVDDELRPLSDTPEKMSFKNHLPEGHAAGTYGSSGVRWVVELDEPSDRYKPGQLIRLFKDGWREDKP